MNDTQQQIQRYPAYKDSGVEWLGEIPEHWEVRRIKSLSRVKRGASPRPIDDPRYFADDGEFSWVRIADVSASNHFLMETTQKLSKLGASLSVKIYPNQIFISIAGTVGKPIISKIKCCIHDGFVYFPDLVNNQEFLFRVFETGQPYLGLGKHGTQLNLNTETIANIRIPYPPPQEQTRIADFLDRKTAQIDSAIAQKERLIALLRERRQILIHNAVTRGLNPDVPMKDSGVEWIGDIPAHWEVKRLKYVANIQSGLTLGKSYHEKNLVQVPYLRVANVQDGFFNLDDITEINIPKYLVPQYLLKQNDILVTEGGDIDKLGRGTVWDGEISPCLHQNHIFAVRCEPIILPQFLAFLLGCNYGKRYFTTTAKKTTNLASTNKTKLDNFPVLLTSMGEQEAISEYIKSANIKTENAINQQQAQIEKLKEYKATLINSAVTGKIQV